jgi:glycosyltransferase involved in cell wall biosynthesis
MKVATRDVADATNPTTVGKGAESRPPEKGGPALRAGVSMLVVSSDTFPPTRVDVTVLFGEELAGRGHRIDWLLQSEHTCARGYVTPWGGGHVWVGATDLGASRFSRLRKHVRGIRNDLRLFKLLKTGGYDIVEVKDKFIAGLCAALASRMYRKRFVYWLSYPFPEAYLHGARDGTARYPLLWLIRGGIFKVLLYRMILPAADHVFVQSEQMRRDVAAEGIPLERMTAVPMGVRNTSVTATEVTTRKLIPVGQPSFLYLGTLNKVRRLDFLIRVLERVLKRVPNAKLYIVGAGEDPSDEQVLIDEAKKFKVSHAVVFVGKLPQREALRYVLETDVCVSPFYPTPVLNSTSPTKLVEYMASGKAVVANEHPEQELIIRESGAGYCVPWDEKAFATAIVKLMQNAPQARRMGALGKQYVQTHRTYSVIADQVERELLRIAAVPRT